MYNTIEIFAEKDVALDLKEILKSSIYNYYKKRRNDLQKEEIHRTMKTQINNEILSKEKGEENVL